MDARDSMPSKCLPHIGKVHDDLSNYQFYQNSKTRLQCQWTPSSTPPRTARGRQPSPSAHNPRR
eukprot:6633163-Alexandrium_andersonii.AAC.1